MKELPKIMVGHCYYRSNPTINFYLGMINTITSYHGHLDIRFGGAHSVVKARNNLVKEFLNSDCEYLFFVDIDMGLPTDGLKKLVEDNKPIIGGLYFQRIPPHNPMLFEKGKFTAKAHNYMFKRDYIEGLTEIDATGAGALLIKKEVFKKVKYPWFAEPTEYETYEDFFFCEKAKDAGYKIYVDTRVKISHFSETLVSETTKRFYDQRF